MIYLDNGATTRVDAEVAGMAVDMMVDEYANPSSPYMPGRDALKALTGARYNIAKVISAPTRRIFFTSGGTESNNLAIQGTLKSRPPYAGKIITTAIEHSSVKDTFTYLASLGYEVIFVKPRNGCIQAEDVIREVDEKTVLLSVMAVNNETGEILPIRDIARGVREKNADAVIHCDCVQGFCKIPFKLSHMDVDLVSVSAHKIHGPKGCGALYIREGLDISPMSYGGAQESKIRPGTENVPSIAAFGLAADKALIAMKDNEEKVRNLRNALVRSLGEIPGIIVNSPEHSSPYILNISVLPVPTEEMIHELRMRSIYVSGSAACKKGAKSHVAEAMGFGRERSSTVLRISFSKYNTLEEIHVLTATIKEIVEIKRRK